MPARRSLLSLCFLPAFAALFFARAALAEEPQAPFGGRGQVALDNLVGLSSRSSATYPIPLPTGLGSISYGYDGILGYRHETLRSTPNQPGGYASSVDMAWFAPSVDVFVRERLSIGGTIAVSLAHGKSTSNGNLGTPFPVESNGFGFTVMPRIGYAIPLGSTFAVWPRLGIGYSGGLTATTSSNTAPWGERWMGDAELGLVTRLHRYVYLNVAPRLSVTVNRISAVPGSRWENTTIQLGGTAGFGILLGS